ncbi:MAG: SDR family oxidoreductase [Bdellovibrionaceae bacterium]|jgi:short-subunit dehydrogenase|nr:SDR family oxidoreductase [Pseudobdellovibrionaceae bacterium]
MTKNKSNSYLPVILVTGCSSGIGLCLAQLLLPKINYRVVVTARKASLDKIFEAGLKETDRFLIRELDVSSRSQRSRVVREIQDLWGGVDILVNNAGFAYRSVMEEMDNSSEASQMITNYLGPMSLIRLVLPYMRKCGRGKIISVSSVSGMLAMPTMGSYSASKHALQGASEALWYELKPFGIDVSLVQPGFINSRSFQNVRYSKKSHIALTEDGPYSEYYKNMQPFVAKLMAKSRVDSKDVAKTILKVIQTQSPRFIVPATPDAVLFYYIRKILPRRWFQPLLFYLLPRARSWAKKHSTARPQSFWQKLKRWM